MASKSEFAIGRRVRVYPGSGDERPGRIVEDFGDASGYAVSIGAVQIAAPSRRWAVDLDDGDLIFVDTGDMEITADES